MLGEERFQAPTQLSLCCPRSTYPTNRRPTAAWTRVRRVSPPASKPSASRAVPAVQCVNEVTPIDSGYGGSAGRTS